MHPLLPPALAWYAECARDLSWRRPGASPWEVMVSEFMLQQTPVSRVVEPWRHWMSRWPTPEALADDSPAEAIRAWGRLGYPRRALRLHAAATIIRDCHNGNVPDDLDELLALPGVGDYTAAAIAVFAYGKRHCVVDTNVRRVLARAIAGDAEPTSLAAERRLAAALLPDDEATAARWSVAVMELGALVCTARSPNCDDCPIRHHCAWHDAGRPPAQGAPRRRQTYDGTDRQCRGRLLAVLRSTDGWVDKAELDLAWSDDSQRERALVSLVDDGLCVANGAQYSLPHH